MKDRVFGFSELSVVSWKRYYQKEKKGVPLTSALVDFSLVGRLLRRVGLGLGRCLLLLGLRVGARKC